MTLNEMVVQLFADIKGWVDPALGELRKQIRADREEFSLQIDALKQEMAAKERRADELKIAHEEQMTMLSAALQKANETIDLLATKDELNAATEQPLVLEGEALDALVEVVLEQIPEPKAGERGEKGEKGDSIDLDGVRAMVDEAVQAIPRPADGKDGVDGKDGLDGKDGADGKDGVDGKDGADGKDGRHALDLEILPEIDFERSYPFGTFAMHDGGLWRANQRTTGAHGWECVVAGMTKLDIDLEDARNVVVKARLSGDREQTKRFGIPTMIYRGVYSDSEVYQKGDAVTRAGSVWHCDKDNPKTTPGSANESSKEEWTLCVKKGAQGRSAS